MTNEEKSMNSATPGGLSPSRTTTLDQESTSRKRILTKNALVHMERNSLFDRSHAVYASITILGLMACCPVGYSQPTGLAPHGPFEMASFPVPAGSSCVLHPDGNSDPAQSIPVRADADGVARFQAVRPAQQDSVDRLALDCTDANGISQTNLVDLRSEATFAPRAFDPAVANLDYRPALSADPLSYTPQELIQGGYGLRPDPVQNPDGYQRWLAAASKPAYRLHSIRSAGPSSASRRAAPRPAPQSTAPPIDAGVSTNPSYFWTGPVLQGSYKKNATSALTYSYVLNEATFNVPIVTPGGFGTGATAMTVWNGLDSSLLLQASPGCLLD